MKTSCQDDCQHAASVAARARLIINQFKDDVRPARKNYPVHSSLVNERREDLRVGLLRRTPFHSWMSNIAKPGVRDADPN